MSPEGQQVARHDLGTCASLAAESEGPAGKRHFRLRAVAERGTAILWLEKEQLQEMGLTIKRLLGSEPGGTGPAPPDAVAEGSGADFDFKVAHLAIGLHRERGLFLILVYDNAGEQGAATLALWASRGQMERLADQAIEVCAAGRPRCLLCGAPITEDEAHVCSRANGHVHA